MYQFRLATFQMFNSHMWPVVTALDSTGLDNILINLVCYLAILNMIDPTQLPKTAVLSIRMTLSTVSAPSGRVGRERSGRSLFYWQALYSSYWSHSSLQLHPGVSTGPVVCPLRELWKAMCVCECVHMCVEVEASGRTEFRTGIGDQDWESARYSGLCLRMFISNQEENEETDPER